MPATSTTAIHLLVADRTFEVPSGLVVHRTRHLLRHHRGEVRGLPVTTPARTVCDLAGELGTPDLRRIVAAAARGHLADATELRRTLRELRRVRGAPRLRPVLEELSPLDAQCRTELETFYLRVARRGGIEPTAMNHPVRDATGGRRYLDAVYLPEHVWVELDGKRTHTISLDRNDDAKRTADVRGVAPWPEPLRFGWADLRDRPGGVVAEVRRALAAAGPPPV